MIRRSDFPILHKKIKGRTMVYFDNAATLQKPRSVIKATSEYYEKYNANVHRGLNPLATEATRRYEEARDIVARFINASREEIIFTRGTTESINLAARTWGEENLKPGDIVVLSLAEHHANIVPWLQLKARKKIKIEYIPLRPDGAWNLTAAKRLLEKPRVKLLAVSQASNVLGIVNPVASLIKAARKRKITTLVDAAQSIAHLKVNVRSMDCDFLAFSGHKIGGPTGIGVLYGRRAVLEKMPPFLGGGDMISSVTTRTFSVNELPYKFEAGTPDIAGAIGLGVICRYLEKLDYRNIELQDKKLAAYFWRKIKKLDFVRIIGSAQPKLPVFSLVISGVHPHDASDILGQEGIILRAGHHCAQPLHDFFGVPASLRASLSFYNTTAEIDFFIARLRELHAAFNS
jgi:cysteine desulfurase/selenocysteine lyase